MLIHVVMYITLLIHNGGHITSKISKVELLPQFDQHLFIYPFFNAQLCISHVYGKNKVLTGIFPSTGNIKGLGMSPILSVNSMVSLSMIAGVCIFPNVQPYLKI